MEQVKVKKQKFFFYVLLFLALIRPSLDIFSEKEIEICSYLFNFNLNLNILIGGFIFLISLLFLIKRLKLLWLTPLFYSIALFLGLSLVSIFYSLDPFLSFREIIRITGIFLLYFLTYQLIENRKDFFLLLKIILISYFLPAFFAVIQFIFGLGLPDDFGSFQRIYGTFAHPNPFAFYTFFILGLVLSLILAKNKEIKFWPTEKINKIIFLVLAGLFTFLLFATYTRSALAGFFGFILIFGLFRYRKLLVGGLLLFLTVYFVSSIFQERIWDLIALDPIGSVVWRLRLWQDMAVLSLWQPWFGYGLNTFTKLTEFYRGFQFGSLEAHNDFLKIFIENGLFGLLAYLWLIIGLLFYLFKIFRNSQNGQKAFSLGLLAIALAIFGVGFFDNILRATALQWNFWILMAGWLKINRDVYST